MIAVAQVTDLQAKFFRGFADPSRLTILSVLRGGALTVSEIVAETGLSQSNTSNHLACLRNCGLVSRQQQGNYVHYQLSDEKVTRLLNLADELLSDVAKGIYDCTRYECAKEE